MEKSAEFDSVLPKELKEKISAKFLEKGLFDSPCPMCHNRVFGLADGLFFHSVYKSIGDKSFSGLGVPCALLICQNCGFISEHSIGFLGLTEELKGTEKNAK